MSRNKFIIFIILTFEPILAEDGGFCSKAYGCSGESSVVKTARYILYDVNVGEGFNLKRDVYMRMAMFLRDLANKSKDDWHLVLPPWTKQWHWEGEDSKVSYFWRQFFDVDSLQLYSPVLELDQFLADFGDTVDEVYILQHFPEFYTWSENSGKMDWSDRWNVADCRDHPYWKQDDGTLLFFRGKRHVKARHVRCISFHGSSAFLESVASSTNARSIMFDRAEIVTHKTYGDEDYWMCRRSMRFAKHLVKAANDFRATHLGSSDDRDNISRPVDWRKEIPQRSAKGGPYLGVHLRRKDFLYGRPNEVPSLDDSVAQIEKFLLQHNLTVVFVATDMLPGEYKYLRTKLKKLGFVAVKFETKLKSNFTEGELAIIDQIIASYARYFVGTHESTFTYRIQEEREIMGFLPETTFNRFCSSSNNKECTPPSKWLIKYPKTDSFTHKPKRINYLEMDEL